VPGIVVDAGPLIALFDRDDRHHRRAIEFVRDCRVPPVTNLPVLTEAAFLLRFSAAAQRDLLRWAHPALDIDAGTAADLPRIAALLDKYRDLPANLADVSLVVLAERLRLRRVASVDRDFAVYRLPRRRWFENVFLRGWCRLTHLVACPRAELFQAPAQQQATSPCDQKPVPLTTKNLFARSAP
jgi:predicted nucleic acid-binding protein